MAAFNRTERTDLIRRFATRLKYPYVFILLVILFLIDLVFPDVIPFLDEAILGFLAVLFGMWKERRQVVEGPPDKNVTPSQ